MGKDCHRCGSPLNFPPGSPAAFCQHCGSPQFLYDSGGDAGAPSTEVAPPPPRRIDWKHAIGAAAIFAAPVGILCSSILPAVASGCCLWVLAGAVAAIGLYKRRSACRVLAPSAAMRIGAVLGLMAAAVAAAVNAGAAVFGRYALHGGDAMEKLFASSMQQGSAMASQMMATSPDETREMLRFWLSPDGRAAATLLTAAMFSVGITVFSMIGGALGARIFSGQSASMRNS